MDNSNNNSLNVYRLLRIARDLKVKELAEKLMVTPAYINAIEKGERIPSKRLIRDYSIALNVDERIITTFSNNKNNSFEKLLLKILKEICKEDDQ
ncbi:MAG: helix-turn-helix transcriptional regulator [Bacillota bacterium]|nr:helix-turn-helix transcriptional regulator [Bacillota bacterium]